MNEDSKEIESDAIVVHRTMKCKGFIPPFPNGNFEVWYPYANIHFHATKYVKPFVVGDGFLRSDHCTPNIQKGNICKACSNLQFNPFIKNVIEKAEMYHDGTIDKTPNEMLSHGELVIKLEKMREQHSKQYLDLQNLNRKNAKLVATISTYDDILNAIATNDIPRIRRLVAVQLNKGSSVNSILEALSSAITQHYTPRLASPDECEAAEKLYDLQSLVLSLGNRKLADILCTTMGLPSISSWNRK